MITPSGLHNPLETSLRIAHWAHWVLNPLLALLILLGVAVFVLQNQGVELARSLQQQAEQQLRQNQPKRASRAASPLLLAEPTEEALWPAFTNWLDQHRVAAGQCTLRRGWAVAAPQDPSPAAEPTSLWYLECQGWPASQATFKPLLLTQGLENTLAAWLAPAALPQTFASSQKNQSRQGRQGHQGRRSKTRAALADTPTPVADPQPAAPPFKVEGWLESPRGRITFNPNTQRWQP